MPCGFSCGVDIFPISLPIGPRNDAFSNCQTMSAWAVWICQVRMECLGQTKQTIITSIAIPCHQDNNDDDDDDGDADGDDHGDGDDDYSHGNNNNNHFTPGPLVFLLGDT